MRFDIRPGVRRLLRFPIRTRAAMKSDAIDVVTPNWFSLMHVRLVRGRPFSPADRPDGPKVVLLNESAAKTFFGADDPIGKRISVGRVVKDAEVIGIVGDVRQMLDSAPGPTTYVPSAQSPQGQMAENEEPWRNLRRGSQVHAHE